MRELPAVAAVEIDRLRADGVTVTDDDVVWLASLGWRVETPRGVSRETITGAGEITLSDGTTLHAMTMRMSAWLERWAAVWAGDDMYLVAFALATGPRLAEIWTARAAVEAVTTWRDSLDVTYAELAGALGRMLDTDIPATADAQPVDYGDITGRLVAITGLPWDYWQDQTWTRISSVDRGAVWWAGLLSASSDMSATQSREALRDMLRAIVEIRNRGKKNATD